MIRTIISGIKQHLSHPYNMRRNLYLTFRQDTVNHTLSQTRHWHWMLAERPNQS